jgi:2,3-bisphosphoglycerate-independent phosphoglycerate mutase
MFALVKAMKQLKVPKLYLHFFGDGRDTSPTSGIGYLKQTLEFLQKEAYGELATIVGRYYAMDRDKRWERIQVAYEALIAGNGERATVDKAVELVQQRYAKGETDEFLTPIVFSDESRIKDGDTLVFFNYRSDRMREITECLGMERYKDLTTAVKHPANLELYGMTQYNANFTFPSLFPPVTHINVLAEWLAHEKVSQFHCAETEKYAHVTFFFNGGRETQFEGEVRCMVPSPKVATYDLQPEMSAAGVADKMIETIKAKTHPFVMCNFAPPDMVGHTGVYEAAVKACEATDTAIGRMFEACKEAGYIMMVTADHGNAEKMIAPDGGKHTAHTCYKVPFTCSSEKYQFKKQLPDRAMALRDVAPNVLNILGLSIPKEMDGVSIVDETN